MAQKRHERYLLALTGLPTASGCEDRVIHWIERWQSRRRQVSLKRDAYGNLILTHVSDRSRRPIVFSVHMDHPAFVTTRVDGRYLEAEFRGGVSDRYFRGASVRLHRGMGLGLRGRIISQRRGTGPGSQKQVCIRFAQTVRAQPGDVLTWDIGAARIVGHRLRAPACDDLAGLAAAIAAFEVVIRDQTRPSVRLLLTRAEEIGFIGAIGACHSGILPSQARVIVVENSKKFSESPLGGGPIVRVGDRTSVFDPELTACLGGIAQRCADRRDGFRWQRRLMPGGTCEATAYQALGFRAACLCLPLDNYHNMNEKTGRIAAETIDVNDFHRLVELLVATGRELDLLYGRSLQQRLNCLFDRYQHLLGPPRPA